MGCLYMQRLILLQTTYIIHAVCRKSQLLDSCIGRLTGMIEQILIAVIAGLILVFLVSLFKLIKERRENRKRAKLRKAQKIHRHSKIVQIPREEQQDKHDDGTPA